MNSIIITGANSGIGFQCALQLSMNAPNAQIILACRDQIKGNEAIEVIRQKTGHHYLKCYPLDLSSLESIKVFKEIVTKNNNFKIEALFNNAGLQNINETQYTKDGIELTFGVNHLGPFYLTLLLLPFFSPNSGITFTSSGTHDPRQKTGIVPPVYINANLLAHPKDENEKLNLIGQKRYSTSKLCSILTVYELSKRLSNSTIRVNAFDPGMVPGTGLARTYPPILRFFWKYLMPSLTVFQRNTNTAHKSGKNLSIIGYSKKYSIFNGKYFEGLKMIDSSDDSYNTKFQIDLWKTSVALSGIKQSETIVELK
jgi:NAD(P)-dependent dehydrogenase (short-subunit alcohol dehydrogenase family)